VNRNDRSEIGRLIAAEDQLLVALAVERREELAIRLR
jgi:hypothetical protein